MSIRRFVRRFYHILLLEPLSPLSWFCPRVYWKAEMCIWQLYAVHKYWMYPDTEGYIEVQCDDPVFMDIEAYDALGRPMMVVTQGPRVEIIPADFDEPFHDYPKYPLSIKERDSQ